MSNVLIVEDESIVAMELEGFVEKIGYSVVNICAYGKDAIEVAKRKPIDTILMDISIKGDIDGIKTAEVIKKSNPAIEIIFLTAHFDNYNIENAAKLNPISYLSKPFNREELKAALSIANLKKSRYIPDVPNKKDLVKLNEEYFYYLPTTTLYYLKEVVNLTSKENQLLLLLIKNSNTIVDSATIEQEIWGGNEINLNKIRALVKRLREKLNNQFIETVQSRGYLLSTKE